MDWLKQFFNKDSLTEEELASLISVSPASEALEIVVAPTKGSPIAKMTDKLVRAAWLQALDRAIDLPENVRRELKKRTSALSVIDQDVLLFVDEQELFTVLRQSEPYQNVIANGLTKTLQLDTVLSFTVTDTITITLDQETGENTSPPFTLNALHEELSLEHVLTYVITGGYHELQGLRSAGSPLETRSMYMDLHVLDEEQSLAFINKPTEGKIPPEIVRQIYIEAGGHIFLLQYLMSALYDHTNWICLSAMHIEQPIEDFYGKHRAFERWWKQLNELDKQVYEVFCRYKEVSASE